MKKYLILFCLICFCLLAFGESVSPLYDKKVSRKLDFIYIEGQSYDSVTVTMKCISPDYFIFDKARVKVKIVDKSGKKIWKKTLYNSFLYVFSNGQIQIGKPNFTQILIAPSSYKTSHYYGEIKLEEGIY